jgi:adenylate kinase
MVGERLESQQYRGGCLFDGFPRTLGQAQALDEYMQGRGTPLDMVIEIRVDEDELFKRLGSRGRQDDDPEVIRERLVAYREQTQPLLEYYERHGILRPILGTGTPDEVFQRIETALNELDRPRVT